MKPWHRWTPEKRAVVAELRTAGKQWSEIAEMCAARFGHSVSADAVRNAFRNSRASPPPPPTDALEVEEADIEEVPPDIGRVPDRELSIEELVALRRAEFKRRKDHETARVLIPIRFKTDDPIGILLFGDPHTDDPGTDYDQLLEHARIVRETPGMFAGSMGDAENNWIGRLQRLYAEQHATMRDGWRLTEHWIERVGKWLFLIRGNHDQWTGPGNPLDWVLRSSSAISLEWEVRLNITFAGRGDTRLWFRHDFPGNSMWNDAHAPMRAQKMTLRDHVAACGHRHSSAYGQHKDEVSGHLLHAVRVASYKRFDDHARNEGHRDKHFSPCAVLVINPRLPDDNPDRIKVFWDPAEAAGYLAWLRGRKV